MLQPKKLTKTCKTGDQARKDMDLVVPKGQVLALIGPSGAGKSTMIRCIKRRVEPRGGQRQRVGIYRALIQNPKLLQVEEPTASLDPKPNRQIMWLITELCRVRGLAAIINTRDVALAQMFVPRVVGLRFGQIVYDGPPDGLTPDKLTEIYGEEDWEATIEKVEDPENENEAAE